MKEQLEALNGITINFGEGGMMIVNIILAFVMFGVALGIKPYIFKEIFLNPKSVIIGVLLQWVALPAVTFAIALALSPLITPMIALGMILVASCPGGNISNFISSLSKANVELSVSLTAISTALAVFMTPFNFWLYGNLYLKIANVAQDVPEIAIPLMDVFRTIFILLGIPLVLGILTSHYLPKLAAKLKKPFTYFSIVFFVAMVVLSFIGNFDAFMKCIKQIFLVVLAHNALALLIGYSTGRAFKLSEADCRTLTIESGIQNSGLGLVLLLGTALFANFPPHGGTLVITAWWGVWHIVGGLAVSGYFNWKDHRKQKKNG